MSHPENILDAIVMSAMLNNGDRSIDEIAEVIMEDIRLHHIDLDLARAILEPQNTTTDWDEDNELKDEDREEKGEPDAEEKEIGEIGLDGPYGYDDDQMYGAITRDTDRAIRESIDQYFRGVDA